MGEYELILDDSERRRLRLCVTVWWIAMIAYTAICAIVGLGFGECDEGTPNFLYVTTAGIILAADACQIYGFIGAKQNFAGKSSILLAIVIASLEVYDYFTDGQQIALAIMCDHTFHSNLVQSYRDAAVPTWLVHVVDSAHMAGLMICGLVLTTLSQIGLTTFILKNHPPDHVDNWEEVASSVMATFSGLGAVPKVVAADTAKSVSMMRAPTTGLFENIPGIYFQGSLFALTFAVTTTSTKVKQIASMVLSGASMAKLAMETVIFIWKARAIIVRNLSSGQRGEICVTVGFLLMAILYVVGSFTMCITCAARVWFSYVCESHLWNLTSGCVELAAD